ncbi:DUF4124 domain-containing protein [Geomonas sp.]|uniref:DUF4124 domain-containing protein n=1 Tax=Geomonas sp. TaxID=2651584 RepID=UPI002B46E94F|nr:hypothetical protein [Geomonas sp.]HJV33512.1 hypothetical protein [Geomonas sp.]
MKTTVITVICLLLLSAALSHADIYTWKDGRGVSHYTNSLHEIPARYLKKARVLDVATGKLGGLATAQPPQKAATGPAAQAGQTPQPAAATPMGVTTSPGAPEPSVSPAAVASPGALAPPPSTIKLPPPTAEAQRKINRMRARNRDRDRSGEE